MSEEEREKFLKAHSSEENLRFFLNRDTDDMPQDYKEGILEGLRIGIELNEGLNIFKGSPDKK